MAHRDSSLGDALRVLCSDHPTRSATRHVVDAAHRLARAYLIRRESAGRLSLNVLGLPLDDLAMDCIAQLFARDETGAFHELQRFFADHSLDTFDAVDAHRALRTLVNQSVNDRLFRCYREADPGLGRIIRNLKRAIRHSTQCHLERRGSSLYVVVTNGDAGTRLLPPDRLAAHLTAQITGALSTPACLDRTLSLLTGHPNAHPHYPVSLLAQSIRDAQHQVQTIAVACDNEWSTAPATSHHLDHLSVAAIRNVLVESVQAVREAKRAHYCRTDDRAAWYDTYMRGVQTYLEAQYVSPDRSSLTHHDALRTYRPSLTRAQYRAEHRHTFEHLLRCTREAFMNGVRATCPPSIQSPNVTRLYPFQQPSATARKG